MQQVTRVSRSAAVRPWAAAAFLGLSIAMVFPVLDGADARSRRSDSPKPAKTAKVVKALEKPAQPLVVIISISQQRLAVYAGMEKIATAPISSGQRGFPTPTGVFTILQKNRTHFSNLYGGAPMPFMQRITWSGVAMHAGVLPGYPASHGCIRLPFSFARDLFGITSMGARVIVTKDAIEPAAIEHARLLTPLPAEIASSAPEPTRTAEAERTPETASDAGGDASVILAAAGTRDSFLPRPKRTRQEALAAREAELVRLADAVTAAQAARVEAVARIEPAAAAVRAAREAVKPARSDAVPFEREAAKAIRSESGAEEELAAFVRRARKSEPGEAGGELGERETALADKHLALAAEADAAREKLAAAEAEVARRAAAADQAAADHAATVTAAKTAAVAVKTAEQALLTAKRAHERRALPVSVFVSRKAGKVFVRQGYEPVTEAAVTIERPDEPLGTHIFTAIEETSDKAGFRWTVASIPTPPSVEKSLKPAGAAAAVTAAPEDTAPKDTGPPPAQAAASALDRVTMPEDTRELVAEFAKPGSSLVISDYGIGNETGKYTDFIVLTRSGGEVASKKSGVKRASGTTRGPTRRSRRSRRQYAPPPGFYW